MAIRTVTFSATANGVTPTSAQFAGVEGEHNATNVVINLSDELVTALGVDGTVYRFEYVDAYDRYDTTDNAELVAPATSVNVDLPNGWTSMGTGTLRLVIAKLDSENEEEMLMYSLPCKLKFSNRSASTPILENLETGLTTLIAETNAAKDAASAAADAAVAVGKKTPEGGEIFNSYTGSGANRATAPYSHAEGCHTTASDYASHAEGNYTTASGECSHAEGLGTQATVQAQTSIGKYNAIDAGALFIVGNGTTSSSRSNAFTVKRDGSATVQTQGTSNNSVIIKSTLDTALANKASNSDLSTHTGNTNNPHSVTAAQVGLGNVDNTADLDKPISTATQAALDDKVDIIEGKVLSDNNYTDTDKAKVDNLPADTNTALGDKADKATTYTKTEVDTALGLKANQATTYTKTEVDTALGLKANQDTTYTKTEVDTALSTKADNTALTETNLRIATVNKSLQDYQSALAQANPNGEPKLTASGYGTVTLPVNAAQGRVSCVVGGVTRTNIIPTDAAGWEQGSIDSSGTLVSSPNFLRTKNYIQISPNTQYSKITNVSHKMQGFFYDKDNNFIADWGLDVKTVTTPATAAKAKFRVLREPFVAGMPVSEIILAQPLVEYGSTAGSFISGTKSTVSAGRVVSENEDETERTEMYIPDVGALRSVGDVHDEIVGGEHVKRIDGDGVTVLATPITTPIAVTGTLIGYPNGTVYFEPVLAVAGVYTATGISVTDESFPIDSIDKIVKIDFETGVETEIDISTATIAVDGLSFTHAELADGDIVFFTYFHGIEGTSPKLDVEYYDSRYTVKDTVIANKFYQWTVTVANKVPSLVLEEV